MSKIFCSVYNGIGNQLFAYALGLYLSKKYHKNLVIDLTKLNLINFLSRVGIKKDSPREYELENLGFHAPVRNFHTVELTKKYNFLNPFHNIADYRKTEIVDNEAFQTRKKVYSIGWGNFNEVKEILPDLRHYFSPNFEFTPELKRNIQLIGERNSVAVHVRRTDYVHPKTGNRFNGICTPEYYKNAIHKINGEIDSPFFIIFSDDIEYVRNNLKIENCIYMNGNPGYVDFYLMSICKHFILANSTFSFWAAILNGSEQKVVCVPEYWYNNPMETEIFIPDEWLRIAIS